jgi:hypothetical protein
MTYPPQASAAWWVAAAPVPASEGEGEGAGDTGQCGHDVLLSSRERGGAMTGASISIVIHPG